MDLLFVNKGLVADVVVGGSLGQRDHEMSEFSVVGEVKRGTRTSTLDSGRQILALFRTLIDRVNPEG